MIPDQRLHDRHERPRDHQKIAVQHADQVEESVESRHDLAGLDPGYVHLRQAQTSSQLGLAPATLVPLFNQLTAEAFGQAIQARGFDR